MAQAIALAPTVDAQNRKELYQRASIDKGGIAGDGRDGAKVLGKYQPKSKLESEHIWVFCGTKGCWLACSPDVEGLSFKGRNFSPV